MSDAILGAKNHTMPKKKNNTYIPMFLLLVLIFAVGVFYLYSILTQYDDAGTKIGDSGQGIASLEYVEKNDAYDVGVCTYELTYPEFLPPDMSDAHEVLNTIVQRQIRTVLDEHAYDCDQDADPFSGYQEEVTYSITKDADGIVSMLFTFSYSAAGSAHPGVERLAVNFDINKELILTEDNYFETDSDYRDQIDAIVLQALEKEVQISQLDAQLPQRYDFYITEDGISIINLIDVYALAYFEVAIPHQFIDEYTLYDN